VRASVPSAAQQARLLVSILLKGVVHRRVRLLPVDLAGAIGETCGRLRAAGRDRTHWMFKVAKHAGLT
jgi:hypothetical protein